LTKKAPYKGLKSASLLLADVAYGSKADVKAKFRDVR
jgi:hypothetical protein